MKWNCLRAFSRQLNFNWNYSSFKNVLLNRPYYIFPSNQFFLISLLWSSQNDIDFRFKLTINLLLGLPLKLMISHLLHANTFEVLQMIFTKKNDFIIGRHMIVNVKKKIMIEYATIRSIALHLIKHITLVGAFFLL